MDLYANSEIEKDAYITKNLEYDNEINKLKLEKIELVNKIPLLHKKEVIDMSMRQYCDGARIKFEKSDDFETKRQFLQNYILKIIYWNDKVELHGSVPVKLKIYGGKETNTELAKIEFCIKDTIPRLDRMSIKAPHASIHRINLPEYKLLKQA